jgi:hypothetical protein
MSNQAGVVPAVTVSERVAALVRTFAAGTVGGAVAGLLVGGVLGRFVMRVIAVLSPPQGVVTDDAAVVGEVTLAGSLALAGFTTALGATGGLVYLLVGRVLAPGRGRVLGFAACTASVGGGFFVHDTASVDFGVLRPQWFSVVAFVALPLLYGLLTPVLVASLASAGSRLQRLPWPAVAVLAMVALAYPETMILGGVAFGVSLVVTSTPILSAVWRSRAVTILGRVALGAVVAVGLFGLAWDIASIVAGRVLDAPPTL